MRNRKIPKTPVFGIFLLPAGIERRFSDLWDLIVPTFPRGIEAKLKQHQE
ncbi:MAG: hypothetical protein MSS85_04520 [Pyramidobacter sp.]|nr:hypothetical protein [Pyramidobacter sp.]MCI7403344.1 hypothetical protein [Pyramidobacter sp.]